MQSFLHAPIVKIQSTENVFSSDAAAASVCDARTLRSLSLNVCWKIHFFRLCVAVPSVALNAFSQELRPPQ
jgi:hypothetical protein